MHAGRSGHPVTIRTAENVEKVRAVVDSERNISTSRSSSVTGIIPTSVRTILKKDLCLKAYKLRETLELKEGDDRRWLEICCKIEQIVNEEQLDVQDNLFSDQSHIYLKP